MAEYIEREAAEEAIYDAKEIDSINPITKYNNIYYALQTVPAADVVEVKHGQWEWVDNHWECTNCRGSRFHDLVLGLDAAYCGRCGAKMDG